MVSGERLLLIAAEAREFSGLVQFCRNVKPLKWPVYSARSADLNGREVLLVANGAGRREAAGVAAKATELGAPFYCLRSVTDLADESFGLDFNAALRPDGRFDTMRLIAASCRRPLSLLPELLRLGVRCRIASRTLGEFVA